MEETILKRKVPSRHCHNKRLNTMKTPKKSESNEQSVKEMEDTPDNVPVPDWIDSIFFGDNMSPDPKKSSSEKKSMGSEGSVSKVYDKHKDNCDSRAPSEGAACNEDISSFKFSTPKSSAKVKEGHLTKPTSDACRLSCSASELFDDDFTWLTQDKSSSEHQTKDSCISHMAPKVDQPKDFESGDAFSGLFSDTDIAFAEMDLDEIQGGQRQSESGENLPNKDPKGSKAEADSNHCALQGKRRSSLLSRKLRQTLQSNVQVPQNSRLSARAQELKMAEAYREAEEIQNKDASEIVQPFGGLPDKVPELFKSLRGIEDLYAWQKECLSLPAVREGRNLIYSLPTSGGKTLVAEVLILRQLLIRRLDAVFILPFVAIVQEKVRTIGPFAAELDFAVEEYAASRGQIPPCKRRKRNALYIATIEKASSLINSLIEHGRMDSIGLIVVDELHMLGEGGSRGATLEMILAKVMQKSARTQIIGMSATLNNIKDLKHFLSAEVFSNDFRPVQLTEYVKMDDVIYDVNSSALCPEDCLRMNRMISCKYTPEMRRKDPDFLAALVQEVVPENSCLVFCPTKKNCENVAQLLCAVLPRESMLNVKVEERKSLIHQLLQDGSGELCRVLRQTIPFGIAYHHSGLTSDERRAIEDAYSEGTLCLLTCTSTLAAGVNLPARRVILRSPYVADQFLSRNQYKQMIGRAGRAGIDSTGESILVLQRKDKSKLLDLLNAPYEHCRSSLLYEESKGLRSLLLNTIGLKITPDVPSVMDFLRRTLCFIQSQQLGINITEQAEAALQKLQDLGLISQKSKSQIDEATGKETNVQYLDTTRLGNAVFKGGVDLEHGSQLYADLKHGLESLILTNHLHLLYLVTPYDRISGFTPNWSVYLHQLSCLDENELRVAAVVGVPEGHIVRKAAGQRSRKGVNEAVVHRFYVTLVLYELWKMKSVWDVAHRFNVPRGQVQQLLTSAASFAFCVAHFCQTRHYAVDLRIIRGQDAMCSRFDFLSNLHGAMSRVHARLFRLQSTSGTNYDKFKLHTPLYRKVLWIVGQYCDTYWIRCDLSILSLQYCIQSPRDFLIELEELWCYQELLGNFVKRLAYCVTVELIPLMDIPGVKLGRAKQLYTAGFHSLQKVASAPAKALVNAIEHLSHKAAHQIISSAQVLLTERAEALRDAADELIMLPCSSNTPSPQTV